MKNVIRKTTAAVVLCLAALSNGNGQQVIGSFPSMDGGMEGQTAGSLVVTNIATGIQRTDWTLSSGSGQTGTGTASATGGRSGPKYLTFGSTGTSARRLQSATAANAAIVNSTSYTVQFYYRTSGATAPTNTANMIGISPDGTLQPGTYGSATLTGTSGSWQRVQQSQTSGSSTASPKYGVGIIRFNVVSTVDIDVDDYVIYSGGADNVAPGSPGAVTVAMNGPNPSTALDVSWGAAGTVDGGGYVVVRYSSSPAASDDPLQQGIYAIGNTVPGSVAGTVAYIGTSTSFTQSGLSPGTTYYFKVYTVDKAFNYSDESSGSGVTCTPPSASPSSNAPICNSSTLNLNANASGTGPLSYQWSGTGTFNDNTSATPSVTGAASGNYTVTVTGACGNATSSVSVSVQNPVTATPSFSATHTTACPGDIKTFSVNAVANATSYTWYDPNSSGNYTFQTPTTGSSVTIEFLAPSNPSTSGYNLRVSGVNLCGTGPYKGQFLSRLVSVPQLSGPNYACPSQVKTYTVPMAIGNASAYKFYAPAGADIFDGANTGNPLTTTSLSVDVTFPPAFVSGNVSVSAIGPCEETALRTIAVKAVPTVSNLTGAASVCPPVNETYTATLVTGATAYDWTFPAGTSVINDNFNVQEIGITNAFTGGNICARATYGCGYSPYRCKAIKVNLPSTPGMITGNKTGVCQSSSESYSVPLVSGLGYNWSANNGATVTPSGNTAGIDFTTATLYPVIISVYSTNGCGQSVTARTLSVSGAPAKPASITGTAAPCSTAVEPYCASSYGATSYIWTLPSGTTFNGANNTSCINANIGTSGGKITAKASNSCGTSQAASLTITVPCRLGEGESIPASSLQLNPNPASGSVLIRFESPADGQVMINLYDLQGRMVLEAGAAVSTGMNDLVIDLKSLSKGIYVLHIQNEYARLVIQ